MAKAPMHPAENRGYRELYLSAREAETRLERLSQALGGDPAKAVANGAAALRALLDELGPETERHELYGNIAAQGGGARIGVVRATILDRFLERNQALRFAVDDLEHVTTLLAYLAELSEVRRDSRLPEFCRAWERKMRRHVGLVRKAAVALASHPDAAIEPLDPSPVGKLAHGSAVAIGAVGETVDRKVAKGGLSLRRRRK